jgi:hypothetical protein
MMERRIINFLVLGMVVFSSCYYDVAETLYPATTCNTTSMSYVTDINPILQQNCFACHSAAANNGNVTLEGYDQLVPYINNGRLLGAIKHQSGFKQMPQNAPQLGSCEISKIEQWIVDGAQNN